MAINATWHKANRMPKNATLDQRIAWHEGHLKHCTCRPTAEGQAMLKKLLAEKKKRG
jgi:hypothetical protein